MIICGTSILCCAGKAFCSNACSCCKSICNTTWKQQIRLAYIILNLIFTLFVIFTFYYLQDLFNTFSKYINCPTEAGGGSECLGASSVYRMSFSLASFYLGLFLLLFICCGIEAKKMINDGLWCFKITYIILVFILVFFIPNSFFEGYSQFAKYISILYMLFQSLVIIDLLYKWSQTWVKYYDQGNQSMRYVLVFTSLILYGLAISLNVLTFIWFKGCSTNTAISSVNIVILVVITFIQILGFNPHGSLIASGGIGLYISFLTFSSQFSSPDSECNSLISNSGNKNGFYFDLSIAIILNFIVLMYITFSSKESTSKTTQNIINNAPQALLADNKEDEEDKSLEQNKVSNQNAYENSSMQQPQGQQQQQQNLNQQQANLSDEDKNDIRRLVVIQQFKAFYVVMFFISIYTCMLITNWGSPDFSANTFQLYQESSASYWIKIIIAWLTAAIYIWTLIAPKIFPNRDFS
ncbi:hypothetical protein ABPG72_004139 [Tetrahymena utriculariae]